MSVGQLTWVDGTNLEAQATKRVKPKGNPLVWTAYEEKKRASVPK